MRQNSIVILLVEDNRDFANLVRIYLNKYQEDRFIVVWKDNGEAALEEVAKNPEIDIILMDYFLPKRNGLEITRTMRERRVKLPIIFVTVNRDFELAVEVMKLEVDDYLVKEEISTPVLPRTILSVLERQKLQTQLMALEISRRRLDVLRKIVADVLKTLTQPLEDMQRNLDQITLDGLPGSETYLTIMKDNLIRLAHKIEQLRSLNSDRTIPYIKDIRMIDLSS